MQIKAQITKKEKNSGVINYEVEYFKVTKENAHITLELANFSVINSKADLNKFKESILSRISDLYSEESYSSYNVGDIFSIDGKMELTQTNSISSKEGAI